MGVQRCAKIVFVASLALIAVSATSVSADFVTGFEPPMYVSGSSLVGQDAWEGEVVPRVQTADEIATELTAAGLNAASPVHGGEQAVIVTGPGDSSTTFRPITGLESETRVVMDVWARPLTPGTPGSTIGPRLGNIFMTMEDGVEDNGVRAAAVRFDATVDENGEIVSTSIDYATEVQDGLWRPSGLSWEADTWYNFRIDADYSTQTYDFYVDDTKVNTDPIVFYDTDSTHMARVRIFRGTDRTGMIVDDLSITAGAASVPGDFDGDGDVDGADFVVWQTNFPTQENATLATGDADGDGDVDGADFVIWQTNFPFTPGSSASPVPEPTTWALATLGGLFALALRRRR